MFNTDEWPAAAAPMLFVASILSGYNGNEVDIKLTGGMLNAEWNGSNQVIPVGLVEIAFQGDLLD